MVRPKTTIYYLYYLIKGIKVLKVIVVLGLTFLTNLTFPSHNLAGRPKTKGPKNKIRDWKVFSPAVEAAY